MSKIITSVKSSLSGWTAHYDENGWIGDSSPEWGGVVDHYDREGNHVGFSVVDGSGGIDTYDKDGHYVMYSDTDSSGVIDHTGNDGSYGFSENSDGLTTTFFDNDEDEGESVSLFGDDGGNDSFFSDCWDEF